MRKVFGGWGVVAETKSAKAACDMCFAPVAAEALASFKGAGLVLPAGWTEIFLFSGEMEREHGFKEN